jgi:hypothetical protein
MPSFVCATNRRNFGINGTDLETLMRVKCCAAIWEYPPETQTKVKYLVHMKRVDVGSLIFMFASGLGVIGVGRATGGPIGPISPGAHSRLRGTDWSAAEWQVPVEWLYWNVDTPCSIRGVNSTFYELTDPTWTERRQTLFNFFKLNIDAVSAT